MAEIYVILPKDVDWIGSWGGYESEPHEEYKNFADAEKAAKEEAFYWPTDQILGVFQLVSEVKGERA